MLDINIIYYSWVYYTSTYYTSTYYTSTYYTLYIYILHIYISVCNIAQHVHTTLQNLLCHIIPRYNHIYKVDLTKLWRGPERTGWKKIVLWNNKSLPRNSTCISLQQNSISPGVSFSQKISISLPQNSSSLPRNCVLRNWDRILVRAVKGLISRAGMVSICPLLWQRDVKLPTNQTLLRNNNFPCGS